MKQVLKDPDPKESSIASANRDGSRSLRLEGVGKIYETRGKGSVNAIDSVDLEVETGEFVSIVGPSGCGKSTLLYIVGGFVEPTAGKVDAGGQQVKAPGPDRGIVFQEFALFPWLTVTKNVRYGLAEQGVNRRRQKEVADRYLEMVGLADMGHLYPKELSGGMKQRVALARTLAVDPSILLLDEPFGALDALTRSELQIQLMSIWEQTKKTVLFVTHSVEEAIFLSDRIYVLSSRPSVVRDVIDVDIPRPRTQEDIRAHPSFASLHARIWRHLQSRDA